MIQYKLAHIGINCKNMEQARFIAETFSCMFGFEKNEGNSSIFLNKELEIMKEPFLGRNGHIAFSTEDVDIAIADLAARGFQVKTKTRKVDPEGRTKSIYLQNELAGFAIHLLRN